MGRLGAAERLELHFKYLMAPLGRQRHIVPRKDDTLRHTWLRPAALRRRGEAERRRDIDLVGGGAYLYMVGCGWVEG